MTIAPLSFIEAIDWAKARGVVLPEIYYGDMQGLARAMSFSIAGVTNYDLLKQTMDSLAQATANGESFNTWKKRVADGEIPLELPSHRIENIFRTNLQGHYAHGRCEQIKRNLNSRRWIMYDAVNDSRTRPAHAAMDGFVAQFDDPIWKKWNPPNGYQCRCRIIPLSEKQAERFRAIDDNNMANDDFRNARHNAVTNGPDKGWDYSVCEEPTEGVKRSVDQKVTDAKVNSRLRGELQTKMEDIRATWPVSGLARRYPVTDLNSLHSLLRGYAGLFPEELPHGVKFVREGRPDGDFYMATDGKGGFWFREIEHAGFNSRRDLFSAFDKCAQRQAMTAHEEYALEALWHEILHNRQTGMDDVDPLSRAHPIRVLAESLHQLVSRLTYPRFVERLGNHAQHQDWVLKNGYGYGESVARLLRILERLGLDIMELKSELIIIDRNTNLMNVVESLGSLLAKKSGAKVTTIQAALRVIGEDKFYVLLYAIKSF